MQGVQQPAVRHTRSFSASLHHSCHRSTLQKLRPRRQAPRRRTAAATVVADANTKPLVVVGSVNADMMLQVDRFPKPGETLSAKSMSTSAGGKVFRLHDVLHRGKPSGLSAYQRASNICLSRNEFDPVAAFQAISAACSMQGANQAAAAASLGYPTYFLGQVLLSHSLHHMPLLERECKPSTDHI